jgi:DNA-binding NtrC family response regulator
VHHFLDKHRPNREEPIHMTETALEMLTEYTWPGNVRQLENTIERAIVLAQGRLVGAEHLLLTENATPDEQALRAVLERLIRQEAGLATIMTDLRQRMVALALDLSSGDRARAARMLQVHENELR